MFARLLVHSAPLNYTILEVI